MKQKQVLYIYDRKEMIVLSLIIIVLSVFAFTLGIHLGKRVGPRGWVAKPGDTRPVNTIADEVPNRQDLVGRGKLAQQVLQESLSQELHDEVSRAGIKIDTQRQVDLPDNTLAPNGGATTLGKNDSEKVSRHPDSIEAIEHRSKYTLQIGSFPSESEAKEQLLALEKTDLKPYLREAEVKGKGKWFRLYLGGFSTRASAEQNGQRYKTEHKIASFIVSKLPN